MLLRMLCVLGLAVSCSFASAAEPVFELGPVVKAAVGPEGHYGFPRLVRAKDGRLLTFYRIGNEHAAGNSSIGVRHSTDDGKTWSATKKIMLDEGKGRGYSCLTSIDNNTIGILYESSMADMVFQKIDINELW